MNEKRKSGEQDTIKSRRDVQIGGYKETNKCFILLMCLKYNQNQTISYSTVQHVYAPTRHLIVR